MTETAQVMAAFNSNKTFSVNLGIRLTELGDGTCRAVFPYSEFVRNRTGAVHGGAVSTMLDVVMGMALRGLLTDEMHAATVDMTTQYLSQAVGDLEAVGRVVKHGRSLSFTAGEVYDSRGRHVASGTGSYFVHPLTQARERAAGT